MAQGVPNLVKKFKDSFLVIGLAWNNLNPFENITNYYRNVEISKRREMVPKIDAPTAKYFYIQN
jgi:hypothetical protein